MGYIEQVLRLGENVAARGKLHWIIYTKAFVFLVAAVICFVLFSYNKDLYFLLVISLGLLGLAIVFFIIKWIEQFITEIAVTNRRVIYKRGFISRYTAEMNLAQVETVNVDQSLLGRLLGYGTIRIAGSGSGLEYMHNISDPVSLRNAITAR